MGKKKLAAMIPVPETKLRNAQDDIPSFRETKKEYARGKPIDFENVKLSKSTQHKLRNYEKSVERAAVNSYRTHLLLPEESGHLEVVDDGGVSSTSKVKQSDIVKNVELGSAKNYFSLPLNEFGPYIARYTHNGKLLLLGGARGHLAAIDWRTRSIKFEVHLQDRIRDIAWLHNETRVAVAQKEKVFVYDNRGVELSRIKPLHHTTHMDFLRYHFLLVCARKHGFLTYVDVSTGKVVVDLRMGMGDPTALSKNPTNALMSVGHSNGSVSLWSPNSDQYLLKMLCHPSPVVSVAISPSGNLMATSDMGRFLKIWDVRACKNLRTYKVAKPAASLTFSQRSLLAFSVDSVVEVWKDVDRVDNTKWRYMRHQVTNPKNIVNSLQFCPYEDILGVGHAGGIESLIIPGSGSPNFDAWEANPFETTKQRQENEVRAFLDKIQPQHISAHADSIVKLGKPIENEQELLDEHMIKRLFPRVRTKARTRHRNSLHFAQIQSRGMVARERRRLKNVREARELAKNADDPTDNLSLSHQEFSSNSD